MAEIEKIFNPLPYSGRGSEQEKKDRKSQFAEHYVGNVRVTVARFPLFKVSV